MNRLDTSGKGVAALSDRLKILSAGFLTGAAASVFPACGNILTDSHMFGLSSTRYGSLFVAQTVMAIVSSLLSSQLKRWYSFQRLLQIGLLSITVAMALLSLMVLLGTSVSSAYCTVLAAILSMGIGIGVGITTANVLAVLAWNSDSQRGVAALHAALGLGLMLSPLLVSAATASGYWWLAPLAVLVLAVYLAFTFDVTLADAVPTDGQHVNSPGIRNTGRLLTLGALALLYGIAEATFSNWCVIFLRSYASMGIATAGIVLSGFWGAVMFGRLLFTLLPRSIGRTVAVISPVIMTASFLLIAMTVSSGLQIVGYCLAGIGCAAVYPWLLGQSAQLVSYHRQSVSGMMVATVLAGTGGGTFVTAALIKYAGLDLPRVYLAMSFIPLLIGGGIVWLLKGSARR